MNWFFSSAPKHQASFITHYLQVCKQKYNRKTALRELSYVVLDTETTGLNPKKDLLLSIGAVRTTGYSFSLADTFEATINQVQPKGSESAVSVHGIRPSDSRKGMFEAEALERFIEFAGNSILVAHHAAFDIAMLNKALKKHFNIRLLNPVLDTAQLAARLEQSRSAFGPAGQAHKYDLDSMTQRYRVQVFDRHTAPGDAFITAILLMKLLERGRTQHVERYEHLF